MHVEGQVHIEGQVHVKWPVHVEQQVQVRHHIVVGGNGIKGDGGGCCAVGNGDGTVGFCGGFGHVRWWAHIEWQHWVVGMGVRHCGWFSEWAREGPSSNSTQ